MIVSIHQPAYLPWLGYFHRIAVSDLHIVLDHAQFEKNSFTNRNKIRTKDAWIWLTVPVRTKGRFGKLPINLLEIAEDPRWNQKHLAAIRTHYSRAPYLGAHEPFLRELYTRDWTQFSDLVRVLTDYLLDAFSIQTPRVSSSDLRIDSKKDELVLDLCRAIGAHRYLSGPLGRNYLREPLFADANIGIDYHDYRHPMYSQAYPGFEPGMSALDLLLNHGPRSAQILMSGHAASAEVAGAA